MNIFTDKDKLSVITNLNTCGVFVTLGKDTPNIMVTHWGTLGTLWGREVFSLPIRHNKYSYQIISRTNSFALNVPCRDMRHEISLCDTLSGFSCNKFEQLGLHPRHARSIDAYVLAECGLIAEFKVVAAVPPEAIDVKKEGLFSMPRAHTLFIGELVDCYKFH